MSIAADAAAAPITFAPLVPTHDPASPRTWYAALAATPIACSVACSFFLPCSEVRPPSSPWPWRPFSEGPMLRGR